MKLNWKCSNGFTTGSISEIFLTKYESLAKLLKTEKRRNENQYDHFWCVLPMLLKTHILFCLSLIFWWSFSVKKWSELEVKVKPKYFFFQKTYCILHINTDWSVISSLRVWHQAFPEELSGAVVTFRTVTTQGRKVSRLKQKKIRTMLCRFVTSN